MFHASGVFQDDKAGLFFIIIITRLPTLGFFCLHCWSVSCVYLQAITRLWTLFPFLKINFFILAFMNLFSLSTWSTSLLSIVYFSLFYNLSHQAPSGYLVGEMGGCVIYDGKERRGLG